MILHYIFMAVDQIKNDFLYANNAVFKSFEELRIEVKDRRANKAVMFELQLLGKGIKEINELLERQNQRQGDIQNEQIGLQNTL
jgi:hypothetical protein